EGRGTTHPFRWIGAPWIDGVRLARELNGRGLPGVAFRPVFFTPTFSKHAGTLCAGVEPHVLDPEAFRPVRTGLHLLDALYRQAPERWAWVGEERPFIDLLAGGETLRRHLEGGRDPDRLADAWDEEAAAFRREVEGFWLYRPGSGEGGGGPGPVRPCWWRWRGAAAGPASGFWTRKAVFSAGARVAPPTPRRRGWGRPSGPSPKPPRRRGWPSRGRGSPPMGWPGSLPTKRGHDTWRRRAPLRTGFGLQAGWRWWPSALRAPPGSRRPARCARRWPSSFPGPRSAWSTTGWPRCWLAPWERRGSFSWRAPGPWPWRWGPRKKRSGPAGGGTSWAMRGAATGSAGRRSGPPCGPRMAGARRLPSPSGSAGWRVWPARQSWWGP